MNFLIDQPFFQPSSIPRSPPPPSPSDLKGRQSSAQAIAGVFSGFSVDCHGLVVGKNGGGGISDWMYHQGFLNVSDNGFFVTENAGTWKREWWGSIGALGGIFKDRARYLVKFGHEQIEVNLESGWIWVNVSVMSWVSLLSMEE